MTQQATDLPESLVRAAEEHGWPLDTVQSALAAGFPEDRIERAIKSGMTPEQVQQMLARRPSGGVLGSLQSSIGGQQREHPPLDMTWADSPTERGRLPAITEHGLELGAIEQGSYGFIPDRWMYENDMPRGAYMPPDTANLAASYSIYDKSEVWADNAAALYEEAIRERWISAVDVPWDTLAPLPRHEELAIDQLCTNWSEHSHLGLEAVSMWLEEISYGFHEVKLYLATVCYEFGRHTEAFRKRALSNGGGLGMQTPGTFTRTVYSAMKFTEMVSIQMLLRGSFQISLFERYGDAIGRSDADRKLYQLVARDLRRQLAFATEHLKYFVATQPHKRGQAHAYLSRGEAALGNELRRNRPHNEALMLLLDSDPVKARGKLAEVWKAQLADYRENLRKAMLGDHEVSEFMLRVIEPETAGA